MYQYNWRWCHGWRVALEQASYLLGLSLLPFSEGVFRPEGAARLYLGRERESLIVSWPL